MNKSTEDKLQILLDSFGQDRLYFILNVQGVLTFGHPVNKVLLKILKYKRSFLW